MAGAEVQLFYDDLVAGYVDARDYVRRDWLQREVLDRLANPACRYVLITGEPGAGKSGLIAALARDHPEAPRYFLRRDSTTPMSGGDTASLLMRVGHQLAARRPELFAPERLEVVIEQRVRRADPGATIVGAEIEEMRVSPFGRTAIRVMQEVDELAGDMVGLRIERAELEPRLLEPQVLQYLALLDPAAADPDTRIMVLIDALDEVARHRGGLSVLDWLVTGPELPANVRVVLTSRPDPSLEALRAARAGSIEEIGIIPTSEEVRADARTFTDRLFADSALRVDNPGDAAEQVARHADGNFAYLTAYARALRSAATQGNQESLQSLLRFDTLPAGLDALYGYFLALLRRDIEQLGALQADPATGVKWIPAWEGAGQRLLGVLTVARAPLTLDQLMAFGSVPVRRREAANVLERFLPFLDADGRAWQLFHPSLAEFLGAGPVDRAEWHREILDHYRGSAASWGEIDWTKVDDYGLRHLAEHLLAVDDLRRDADTLVTPGFRAASLERYGTDLPFRRIVDAIAAEVPHSNNIADALCKTLFLQLVHSGLGWTGSGIPPAGFGLMARLGRIDEALDRTALLPPGDHRFRCLEAIRACTPEALRARLGGHDGLNLLAAAALEISATTEPRYRPRRICLKAASVAMARHDLDHALRLAAEGEESGSTELHDAALAAAAQTAPAVTARRLIARMHTGTAEAALDWAEHAVNDRDELLDIAFGQASEETGSARQDLLTRIAALRPSAVTALAEAARSADLEQEPAAGRSPTWVRTARVLASTDPTLARIILERVSDGPVDLPDDRTMVEAARLWLDWGQTDRVREIAQALMQHSRHARFGPTRGLAEVIVMVAAFDPGWARALADEAIAIAERFAGISAVWDRVLIDGTLGGMVIAFADWDRERGLQVARCMSGHWVHGSGWDAVDCRGAALAYLGLRSVGQAAADLFEECLRDGWSPVKFGAPEIRVVPNDLFRPMDSPDPDESVYQIVDFGNYMADVANRWVEDRSKWFFGCPADVQRSIVIRPRDRHADGSWAAVVAEAVLPAALRDLDAAIDLAGWVIEPGRRLLALCAAAVAMKQAGVAGTMIPALRSAADDLVPYVPRYFADEIGRASYLAYIDPSARALFEASLVLPADMGAQIPLVPRLPASGYLRATGMAQEYWRLLSSSHGLHPELVRQLTERMDGNGDEIQADLVRGAGACASDPATAEIILGRIRTSWVTTLARMEIARSSGAEPDRYLPILRGVGEDVSAVQRAGLAVAAYLALRKHDDQAALACVEWGAASAREGDSAQAAWGLAALATATGSVELFEECLARSAEVADRYHGDRVMVHLLLAALRTGDVSLVVETVRRLVESGWTVLMHSLREAIKTLIEAWGPQIVSVIDEALRTAQGVVGDATTEHFDGVAVPALRPAPGWLPLVDEPDKAYLELFLDSDDLPGMIRDRDLRIQPPDDADDVFVRLGGIRTGRVIWMGDRGAAIWTLIDIRWVFPDEEAATLYHRERLEFNSEGQPLIPDAPAVGQECAVYGGTVVRDNVGVEVVLTWYYYLFRVGTVVVKLFACKGVEAPEGALIPAHVAALAERVVSAANRLGSKR
jgi:hypothetical protein